MTILTEESAVLRMAQVDSSFPQHLHLEGQCYSIRLLVKHNSFPNYCRHNQNVPVLMPTFIGCKL